MPTKRFLFLDMDGVFNNLAHQKTCPSLDSPEDQLVPELVQIFCKWLETLPPTELVLSSAWRYYWPTGRIAAALQHHDPRFPGFAGRTVDWSWAERDVEILAFLRKYKDDLDVSAAVLDDWPFRNALLVDPLLVKTDHNHGVHMADLFFVGQKLLTPITAQGINWDKFERAIERRPHNEEYYAD